MKKIVLLVALAFSISLSAQEKITEGKITSKQTMSSDNEQVQAQFDMVGKTETTTFFKDGSSRVEVSNSLTGNVTTVMNVEKDELLMVMDNPQLGKIYSLQKNVSDNENLKGVTVKKGDQTKTVLGYNCTQYIITIDNENTQLEMEVFTTEKLPITSNEVKRFGAEVKGFPLYTTITMNQMGVGMLITTEVTKIEKQKVSSDLFDTTPPEGYKEM